MLKSEANTIARKALEPVKLILSEFYYSKLKDRISDAVSDAYNEGRNITKKCNGQRKRELIVNHLPVCGECGRLWNSTILAADSNRWGAFLY